MSQTTDLLVYAPNGEIALVVEVKGRAGTTREWAIMLRRNLLAHGVLPKSRYLLLALPDRFYLWHNDNGTPNLAEPLVELDAMPLLKPYYDGAGLTPETVGAQGLELIVVSLINELILSGIPERLPESLRRQIEESALVDALSGGNLVVQIPA